MKRFIPQGLFALLVLGVAFASAQNITKSVQLSQDPTGVFNVDNFNNLFFPKHWNTGDQSLPAFSGFGNAASPAGSDAAGTVVFSVGTATSGNLKFAQAYTSTPFCTASSQSGSSPVGLTPTPQGISFTFSAMATGSAIYYQCTGRNTG